MNHILSAVICGALTLTATATDLKVDKDRSRIQVDAQATGHTFTGTLNDYKVKVSGNNSTLKPSAFSLEWDFKDLNTADVKRDKEMLSWLGGGTPKGSFTFIKTWDDAGKHFAQGSLTIHGTSKTIAFPYTATKKGNWVTIDGAATLDYKDFGLPLIRSMAVMTVDPKLTIRFHLVGKY